mgnify:CR=1 FL=1
MGYSTQADVEKTIAQALTSATASSPDDFGSLQNLMNIGNSLDKNLIPDQAVDYYIQLADQEIDSLLSELYETPFCEKVNFESELYSDINEYNPFIVLENNCPLAAGDIVVLKEGDIEERHIISIVEGSGIFSTVDNIDYLFSQGARVLRLSYPAPLKFISARLASAAIYDKYFSSEASPNTSKFGEMIRGMAYDRINDVLTGKIIIHGAHRIGRRFYNPNLVDEYSLLSGGKMNKDYRQR